MADLIQIVGGLAFVAIMVGVPLSILRSLDEMKASQKRLEAHMEELAKRLDEEKALR